MQIAGRVGNAVANFIGTRITNVHDIDHTRYRLPGERGIAVDGQLAVFNPRHVKRLGFPSFVLKFHFSADINDTAAAHCLYRR